MPARAEDLCLIINPNAGRGWLGKNWPSLLPQLERVLGSFQVLQTSAKGTATDLTLRAIDGGAKRIVAAGGDGTINEVANGLMIAQLRSVDGLSLGVLHCGTGGDLRRNLRIPFSLTEAALIIAENYQRPIDVGCAQYRTPAGATEHRYFLILAAFGIAAPICRFAAQTPSWLNGKAAFLWATLRALPQYRDQRVRLKWSDSAGDEQELKMKVCVLTNGAYCGGGMCLSPNAVLDDGQLDAISVSQIGLWRAIRNLHTIYAGRHFELPEVAHRLARTLHAEAVLPGESVELELDGEVVGMLPARFSVISRGLRVIAPRLDAALQEK